VNRTIRRVWGAPFAVLSVAAFGVGALFHHQALDAAASETARKKFEAGKTPRGPVPFSALSS